VTTTAGMPAHAPYTDVEVGEPVEIIVREHPEQPGVLIAEFEFRGDKFGLSDDLNAHSEGVARTLAIDSLITEVAKIAWHECYATPLFREEDDEWIGRVDVARPWEKEPRQSTQFWIAEEERVIPDAPLETHDDPDAEPTVERARRESRGTGVDLTLTPEEATALARGEFLPGVREKILASRSTLDLLNEAHSVLVGYDEMSPALELVRDMLGEVLNRQQ
jgi:hypothetical protein